MSSLTILHVILIAVISSSIAYAIASWRSAAPWLVVGCIAGAGTGVVLSFVLSFFLYPSLGLVAEGEDFLFQTYALFRTAALFSVLFSGLAVVMARMRSR